MIIELRGCTILAERRVSRRRSHMWGLFRPPDYNPMSGNPHLWIQVSPTSRRKPPGQRKSTPLLSVPTNTCVLTPMSFKMLQRPGIPEVALVTSYIDECGHESKVQWWSEHPCSLVISCTSVRNPE